MNGKFSQGHWSNSSDSDDLRSPQADYAPAVWKTELAHTLDGFVRNLVGDNRDGSVLVLNAGHHAHHFRDRVYAADIAARATALFGKVIWKTTTFVIPSWRNNKHKKVDQPHDYIMCSMTDVQCWNISWVGSIKEEHYSDFLHYKAPVYNLLNARMIHEITG